MTDHNNFELQYVTRRGREWHSTRGLFQYIGAALSFLLVASFFNEAIDLGRTGQMIVVMILIGGTFYYHERQK